MGKPELDPLTGQYTTGHSWNGIRELRMPVPKWWMFVWLCSIGFALIYVWLLPALPTLHWTTGGSVGFTSRLDLEKKMEKAHAAQAKYRDRIASSSLEEILADKDLAKFAYNGGKAAFAVNCIACHGAGAGGQIGQFPSLIDDDWIWGGSVEDIYTTINHGIRSNDESRASEMPTFGDILTSQEISQVADYVVALNKPGAHPQTLPGAKVFSENCVACHGEGGVGGREFGAPRLNDAVWLYGSGKERIVAQITHPKMGVMPAFGPRLADDTVVKMLAVYVHGLGGGETSVNADEPSQDKPAE